MTRKRTMRKEIMAQLAADDRQRQARAEEKRLDKAERTRAAAAAETQAALAKARQAAEERHAAEVERRIQEVRRAACNHSRVHARAISKRNDFFIVERHNYLRLL